MERSSNRGEPERIGFATTRLGPFADGTSKGVLECLGHGRTIGSAGEEGTPDIGLNQVLQSLIIEDVGVENGAGSTGGGVTVLRRGE